MKISPIATAFIYSILSTSAADASVAFVSAEVQLQPEHQIAAFQEDSSAPVLPPLVSNNSSKWFTTWQPAYLACKKSLGSSATNSGICKCQFNARTTAHTAGEVIPMMNASALMWDSLVGSSKAFLGSSIIFDHSPAQSAVNAEFLADMVSAGCGPTICTHDCGAKGDALPDALESGLCNCSCIKNRFLAAYGATSGPDCSSINAASDATYPVLLTGVVRGVIYDLDGKTPVSVGPFAQPSAVSQGEGLPGSQVLCQNNKSVVYGICPSSPGRTECLPGAGCQNCGCPTVPPPSQNSWYKVNDNGLVPQCNVDGPSNAYFDDTYQACVEPNTGYLCNNRGLEMTNAVSGDPICACDAGYSGSRCEIVHGCSEPCDHVNQFCNVSATGGPKCQCLPNYFPDPSDPKGKPCSGYDPSSNKTCAVSCIHGSCAQPLNCSCADGWTGDDCSVPICPFNNCNGNGKCDIGPTGKPTCVCPYIYKDQTSCDGAEVAIPGVCKHNSAPSSDGSHCVCVDGWAGLLCDTPPACSTCCPNVRCTCFGGPTVPVCRFPWHPSGGFNYCCNWYHCVEPDALAALPNGQLARLGELKAGDRVLSLLETQGKMLVEEVREVTRSLHELSSVFMVCHSQTPKHALDGIIHDDDDDCLVASARHNVMVKLLPGSAEAELVAKMGGDHGLQTARSSLSSGGLIEAFAADSETSASLDDIVRLIHLASPHAVTDMGEAKAISMAESGVRLLQGSGRLSDDSEAGQWVVIFDIQSPRVLPKRVTDAPSFRESKMVELISYIVPSARQTIGIPSLALSKASPSDVAGAVTALGLSPNQPLCQPGTDKPLEAFEAVTSIASNRFMATANCTSNSPASLQLSQALGGLTWDDAVQRGHTSPTENELPVQQDSITANDEYAVNNAHSVADVAGGIFACPARTATSPN